MDPTSLLGSSVHACGHELFLYGKRARKKEKSRMKKIRKEGGTRTPSGKAGWQSRPGLDEFGVHSCF